MKKVLIYILSGIGVILVLALVIVKMMTPTKIDGEVVELKKATLVFTEEGVAKSENEESIIAQVTGKVLKVNVKEGDMVHKEDVLAEIDPTTANLMVEVAKSNVEKAKAGKEQAINDYENSINVLEAHKSALLGELGSLSVDSASGESSYGIAVSSSATLYEDAADKYEKSKILYEEGYISETELEHLESIMNAYKTESKKAVEAKESTSKLKSSLNAQISNINEEINNDTLASTEKYYDSLIKEAELNLQLAEEELDKYILKSSISGKVSMVNMEVGESINPPTELFFLSSEGENYIETYVSTSDVYLIEVGDEVKISMDKRNGEEEFYGRIDHIGESAVDVISSLGVNEKKVKVKIKTDNKTVLGYSYDVSFYIVNEDDKIVVKSTAIFEENDKKFVLVIENGKIKKREVVLGEKLFGETIIESGLEVGDKIVNDASDDNVKIGIKAVINDKD